LEVKGGGNDMTTQPQKRMVDNEVYQNYVLKLVEEGHDGLTVLDKLLKLSSEYGESDIHSGLTEQEQIKIASMDKAYSNVQDWIHFIKGALEK
jgi:hypothetical protein